VEVDLLDEADGTEVRPFEVTVLDQAGGVLEGPIEVRPLDAPPVFPGPRAGDYIFRARWEGGEIGLRVRFAEQGDAAG
jgi:hypothetical protein